MNSQKEVHLNILSENEAWALFKDKAGVEDDSPTLIVAKEVARECNGLPLAIVTVAKALKVGAYSRSARVVLLTGIGLQG
ncbi:NB-ARC - like 10 [Theobroma cacao]|nr:NB-ARC - like 10 [Theobroma cacao]